MIHSPLPTGAQGARTTSPGDDTRVSDTGGGLFGALFAALAGPADAGSLRQSGAPAQPIPDASGAGVDEFAVVQDVASVALPPVPGVTGAPMDDQASIQASPLSTRQSPEPGVTARWIGAAETSMPPLASTTIDATAPTGSGQGQADSRQHPVGNEVAFRATPALDSSANPALGTPAQTARNPAPAAFADLLFRRPAGDPPGQAVVVSSADTPGLMVGSLSSTSPSVPAPAAASPAPLGGTPPTPQALSDQVFVAVQRGDQQIELMLEPADLGRLRIQLQLDGDQVNLQFQSANPAAREAIESALPRLREMLADQGLQLGETAVGDQGHGSRRQPGEPAAPRHDGAPVSDPGLTSSPGDFAADADTTTAHGLIDLYA